MADNRLQRTIKRFDKVPAAFRGRLISMAFSRAVPYINTSGCVFEKITPEEVIVSVVNRRKVQNHIKGVHAVAMALLAETSTGFVVGMNLPDDKLPLIKSMTVEYKRRSQGSMRAVAHLTEEQKQMIREQDKGEVLVPVKITDESGEEPIQCQMLWAWVPKKRK